MADTPVSRSVAGGNAVLEFLATTMPLPLAVCCHFEA